MKKMQKIISIILSAVLVLSLCVATPMTASAKQDSVSDALAAAVTARISEIPRRS